MLIRGIGESSQSQAWLGLPVIIIIIKDHADGEPFSCHSPSALLVFPATVWCISNYPFLRCNTPYYVVGRPFPSSYAAAGKKKPRPASRAGASVSEGLARVRGRAATFQMVRRVAKCATIHSSAG